MTAVLLLLIVGGLAYANGANDTFKGVATLMGSRSLDYRRALSWALATTLLGSLASLFLAHGLIKAFSGKGLVPDELVSDPQFLSAVGLGAGLTVLLATLSGLPISTTHALTGALTGAGLAGAAAQLNLSLLGSRFFLPLLLSPFLAFAATAVLYRLFRWVRLRLGVERESCLCVEVDDVVELVPVPGQPQVGAVVTLAAAPDRKEIRVVVGEDTRCVQRYGGRVLGLRADTMLRRSHLLSAGAVGFARGLNDTPKMAALLVAAPAVGVGWGATIVALAMALGGLLNARKVADTMSERITDMNEGQGFTGNLVSALLVTVASRFGVPVSTTHVTCGSLFGIGLVSGQGRWKTIGTVLLAWVLTLPLAALLAALSYWCLG